ncbi:MAG: DEAD/DEAH box helicase [Thermoflexales bacterium]
MTTQLALAPSGHLYLADHADRTASTPLDPSLCEAFARGQAPGILALAAWRGAASLLAADVAFWRDFGRAFLATLARAPVSDDATAVPLERMPEALGAELTLAIPAMPGAEYASPAVFGALWEDLRGHAQREATRAGAWRRWLSELNPALHLVGRVTFHLAENKRSPDTPFAFMATYTHRLSSRDLPVHLPLARALQDYAGANNQAALRSLLDPVQRAAEGSAWARELLNSRAVFAPQAWTPPEAYAFLREVPALEASGIITRIPNWWTNGRGARPQVSVRIGEKKQVGFGADSMLDFSVSATLDGETLTAAEWQAIQNAGPGLVSLRGQWVEVDANRLRSVLDHWKRVEEGELGDGVSFAQAMRLIAGAPIGAPDGNDDSADTPDWREVVAGAGLREVLEHLREPGNIAGFDPGRDLKATLRPYQSVGAKWMWFLQRLGLGACLADDMGLGKTIQVIAVLLQLKREAKSKAPALLVAPASLLANWQAELARFAPSLVAGVMHPSETPVAAFRDARRAGAFLAGKDLILTTYGQVARLGWLAEREWRLVILDEAQAIKNPAARQTRAVKRLRAPARIALSGTPIENRLGDLWSLYDFLNPGLLGGAQAFGRYVKRLQDAEPVNFAPLRALTRPYLLRRLKTDRSIIADLPDKVEVTAWCGLSKRQAALYQSSVDELGRNLSSVTDGMQRRGMVLAFLMRFKQICNHPSHWLGDGAFDPAASGKFARLAELGEEIASRGEKALIFTQFREMTEPLAVYLRDVFGRPGLILHGSTAIKDRQRLVAEFQRDDGPPFFVLSLKAGGVGLNLTAANHVIHFDRWWNPAVENQATDRAFRIGQMRNVLVHKFVCRGTIEERIDTLISDKKALSAQILDPGAGAEAALTEMSNDELLRFVALDLKSASEE